MDEPTINNMVQRFDRLERENRRLKRIGSLVVVGIAAVVLMGQAKPGNVAKVIETRALVIRDESGKGRVALTASEDGGAFLGFTNKKGKLVVSLGIRADGVYGLEVKGTDGNNNISLSQLANGKVGLLLRAYDNSAVVTIQDRNLKGSVELLVPKKGGAPTIQFFDKYNKHRILLSLFEGAPVMGITDEDGKTIWSAP